MHHLKTFTVFTALLVFCRTAPLSAQESGLGTILEGDLKQHMEFLASDELKGRDTGEPGLEIAARYLAVQAERLGLEPAPEAPGYMQYFTIVNRSYDWEKTGVEIISGESGPRKAPDPFYVVPAVRKDSLVIEGEVVFAGYGISDPGHGYDDLEAVDIEDKVVLIMNRAPMNKEGTRARFDPEKWGGWQNMQHKIPELLDRGARAILLAMDPKSGMSSLEDLQPGIARYLTNSRYLKGEGTRFIPDRAPTVLVHANLADQLLASSGHTLESLQHSIDSSLTPNSFPLEGTSIRLKVVLKTGEIKVPNVFGMVEGSDPDRKNELVLFVAHFDHVGTDGRGGVFNGADDNASGTVALIELAEAFMKEKDRPARSIGFLWVAAEEIGLYGSRFYARDPLIPLESTSAVINLDMVGRTRTPEDAESGREGLTIVGGDSVKVIGGLQSSVLMRINEDALSEMGMVGNYHYNNPDDPARYFYRSDHINFAREDIPVLFYSTGTHRDYHRVTDTPDRIDYAKFLKMARLSYLVGYETADYNGDIEVDNPMSDW